MPQRQDAKGRDAGKRLISVPTDCTPEQFSEAVRAILRHSSATDAHRVELLAGALVVEALQPYWRPDRTPAEAHSALRRTDPELADTIEAIAPLLLARLERREESTDAIVTVERMLGFRR